MPGVLELYNQRGALVVDDVVVGQAAHVIEEATDDPGLKVLLRTASNNEVEVPDRLAELLLSIVSAVSTGSAVTILTMPEELSTSVAADELGISRPTLMKLIRQGEIPHTKVGTHTRVAYKDIVEFKKQRASKRQESFEALRAYEESIEGND